MSYNTIVPASHKRQTHAAQLIMDILGIVVVPCSFFSNLSLGNRLTQQAKTGLYANGLTPCYHCIFNMLTYIIVILNLITFGWYDPSITPFYRLVFMHILLFVNQGIVGPYLLFFSRATPSCNIKSINMNNRPNVHRYIKLCSSFICSFILPFIPNWLAT